MFCSSCGKQINDGAKFCNFCGATQVLIDQTNETLTNAAPPISAVSKNLIKEGQTHKCPYCGEILGFDAITCPSCGNEIRGKQSLDSINDLVNKIRAEPNEEKKIELIKLYPIPNTREAIFEFMVVAASQFDAKFYASNPTANSISGAWYSQIDLCYKKGQMMFKDASDLARLEQLYNAVNGPEGSLTKEKYKRRILAYIGIGSFALGALLFIISMVIGTENPACTPAFLGSGIFIGVGLIIFLKVLKKKKTSKELEIEKEQQAIKAQARKDAIERKDRLQREAAERNARR
ncbi:MAG: zinc ribbon domain-containing protein [Saccharofermentans sp.]|nr:zinc ribbon domain-containing protein [Saccharofermentans sp.]